MAITINKLNKPWIWVEATTGGSLSAATYYFIGYIAYDLDNGPYYGHAPSPASDQFSVTTDATNNRIKMEIYELGGYVTAYADTGDSTHVTVTSNGHGLSNSDTVYLRGTANYTGNYTISSVTANTFDIVATWVADDGASNWYKTPGMPTKPTNYPYNVSFYFKWDYYSMLRGDGTYFQWMNTNDTGEGITNEWYFTSETRSAIGHKRWGGSYYYSGVREGVLTTAADSSKYKYFDAVVVTTAQAQWTTTNLYETGTSGSVVSLMAHPQIAMRKYTNTGGTTINYQLPEGMTEDSSAALIFVDATNDNNSWRYLAAALDASSCLGESIILTKDKALASNATDNDKRMIMMIRGLIVLEQSTSWTTQPVWYNKNIVIIHGNIRRGTSSISSANVLKLVGCNISFIPLNNALWANPQVYLVNTTATCYGNSAYILDYVYTLNGTPYGPYISPSYYVSCEGTNFLGSLRRVNNTCQVMRNNNNGQYVRDCTFTYIVCYKDYVNTSLKTFEFTDCTFYQPQSDLANSGSESTYNFDFYHAYSNATTSTVAVDVYNWTNCSAPDRASGIIRISFSYGAATLPISADSTITHNFMYDVNLTVTDTEGNPIENATVTVVNSASIPVTYTDTTDSNGETTVTPKCYTIVIDSANTDGYKTGTYPFFSKTNMMNDLTLTISKSGYETYRGKLDNVLEAQDMTIALKTAGIQTDQEQAIQI